jgi:hypothetical protein
VRDLLPPCAPVFTATSSCTVRRHPNQSPTRTAMRTDESEARPLINSTCSRVPGRPSINLLYFSSIYSSVRVIRLSIMAQPDTHERSHAVVIDVADDGAAAAGEPPRCCCVCTEPLEWVAVGQCGHRDVCAACATRIRFFGGDRRCCVCRALLHHLRHKGRRRRRRRS